MAKEPWDMSAEELLDEIEDAGKWGDSAAAVRAELLRRLSAGNPQAEKVQISDDGMVTRDLLRTQAERRESYPFCANDHECCNELRELVAASERAQAMDELERAAQCPDGLSWDKHAEYCAEPERSDGRIAERDFEIATQDPVFVRLFERYKAEAQTRAAAEMRAYEKLTAMGGKAFADAIREARSGEQRETRVQGGSSHAYDGCHDCRVASAANVDREQLVAKVRGEGMQFGMEMEATVRRGEFAMISHGNVAHAASLAPTCKLCQDSQAQRSAGRVEAGSEQVTSGCGKADCTDEQECDDCEAEHFVGEE